MRTRITGTRQDKIIMKLGDFFAKYDGSDGGPLSHSMHMIRPNLWLGSIHARQKKNIEYAKIQTVFSLLTDYERELSDYCELDQSIEEYKIDFDDNCEAPLIEVLDWIEPILDKELEMGHCCLVHCRAGVSRSASVVIGYLMRKEKLSYQEAYTMVKEIRLVVFPGSGFREKLLQNCPASS